MAGIVLAIASLTALWGGVTQQAGNQVENRYPQTNQPAHNKVVNVANLTVTGYQGGFFKSRVDWELAIQTDPCDPTKKYVIHGYDDISRGLSADLKTARVKTHIIWPEDIKEKLGKVYSSTAEPVEITTTVSLLGTRRTHISNMPFVYEDKDKQVSYKWGGMQGDIVKYRRGAASANLTAPSMEIVSTDSEKNAKIGFTDLLLTFSGSNLAKGVVDSETRAKIRKIFVHLASNRVLQLNNVNYQDAIETPEEVFQRRAHLAASSVIWNHKNIGQLSAKTSVQTLDDKVVGAPLQQVGGADNICKSVPDTFVEMLRPLFGDGFKLTLDDLDLNLNDTHVRSNALLTVNTQQQSVNDDAIEAILEKLQFDGHLNVDKAYLRQFVGEVQANNSEAQLKKNISKVLKEASTKGYLKDDGDSYELNVHLDENGLFANNITLVEQKGFVKTVSETLFEEKQKSQAGEDNQLSAPMTVTDKMPEPAISSTEKNQMHHR